MNYIRIFIQGNIEVSYNKWSPGSNVLMDLSSSPFLNPKGIIEMDIFGGWQNPSIIFFAYSIRADTVREVKWKSFRSSPQLI